MSQLLLARPRSLKLSSHFCWGLQREDGQAVVETALSLILAFSLAFLLFEASMLAYTYSVMNNAAREGVRYAIAHGIDSSNCSGPGCGNDAAGDNVIAVVRSYAATSFHDISGMTVTVDYSDPPASPPHSVASAPLSLVTVTVNYTFIPYFNFPAISTLHLTSQGRILY